MLEIQQKQLERATQILAALNCTYAIKLPDGTVVGELQVVEPKSRTRSPTTIDYGPYQIKEKLDTMQIGDVLVIDVINGHEPECLRGNVSARGSIRFGKGNFTTAVVGKTVQCMRMA